MTSYCFEVWYKKPESAETESQIMEWVEPFRGRLDYREDNNKAICLTLEFPDYESAHAAYHLIHSKEFHVESFCAYGEYENWEDVN